MLEIVLRHDKVTVVNVQLAILYYTSIFGGRGEFTIIILNYNNYSVNNKECTAYFLYSVSDQILYSL